MPGINGPKMSAKIRSYEKEKKISEGDKRRVVIIGLTGHDSLAV
jgi:predicted thioesterase